MENLTLVIPAKNEGSCLPQVLDELKKFECKKLIIVDKNDVGTISAIENKNCEILKQKTSGYGNALIEGINHVKTPFMCIFNADGSFDPKYLSEMLNKIVEENNDFIFASRYLQNAGSDDDTFITLLGNKIFSFIGNLFFKLRLTDILYTFVMGKSDKFKELYLKNSDFRICVEIPIKIKNQNLSFDSIPSFERSRISGKKKVNALLDGSLILIEMIKLFFMSKKNPNDQQLY